MAHHDYGVDFETAQCCSRSAAGGFHREPHREGEASDAREEGVEEEHQREDQEPLDRYEADPPLMYFMDGIG